MRTVARTLQSGVRGFDVVIGEDAYRYADPLAPLEEALA
jgi:hypothetical protein